MAIKYEDNTGQPKKTTVSAPATTEDRDIRSYNWENTVVEKNGDSLLRAVATGKRKYENLNPLGKKIYWQALENKGTIDETKLNDLKKKDYTEYKSGIGTYKAGLKADQKAYDDTQVMPKSTAASIYQAIQNGTRKYDKLESKFKSFYWKYATENDLVDFAKLDPEQRIDYTDYMDKVTKTRNGLMVEGSDPAKFYTDPNNIKADSAVDRLDRDIYANPYDAVKLNSQGGLTLNQKGMATNSPEKEYVNYGEEFNKRQTLGKADPNNNDKDMFTVANTPQAPINTPTEPTMDETAYKYMNNIRQTQSPESPVVESPTVDEYGNRITGHYDPSVNNFDVVEGAKNAAKFAGNALTGSWKSTTGSYKYLAGMLAPTQYSGVDAYGQAMPQIDTEMVRTIENNASVLRELRDKDAERLKAEGIKDFQEASRLQEEAGGNKNAFTRIAYGTISSIPDLILSALLAMATSGGSVVAKQGLMALGKQVVAKGTTTAARKAALGQLGKAAAMKMMPTIDTLPLALKSFIGTFINGKDKGLDDGTAAKAAFASSYIEMLLEKNGLQDAIKTGQRNVLIDGIFEGLEEIFQDPWSAASLKIIGGLDIPWTSTYGEGVIDVPRALEAGASSFLAGAGADIATGGLSKNTSSSLSPQAQQQINDALLGYKPGENPNAIPAEEQQTTTETPTEQTPIEQENVSPTDDTQATAPTVEEIKQAIESALPPEDTEQITEPTFAETVEGQLTDSNVAMEDEVEAPKVEQKNDDTVEVGQMYIRDGKQVVITENDGKTITVNQIGKDGKPNAMVDYHYDIKDVKKKLADGTMSKADTTATEVITKPVEQTVAKPEKVAPTDDKQATEQQVTPEAEPSETKVELRPIDKAKQARDNKYLSKEFNYDGKVMTRRQYLEESVAQGRRIENKEVTDTTAKNKLMADRDALRKSGTGLANPNHPNAKRLAEIEKKLADGVTKSEYRLYVNDKEFRELTKIEYDYAMSLEKPNGGEIVPQEKEPRIKAANNDIMEVDEKPHQTIANFVKEKLTNGENFSYADLTKAADEAYGGTQGDNTYTSKDATDAMELGINQYLVEQSGIDFKSRDPKVVKENIQKLRDLLALIPTQTKRTTEQVQFQQFSTPPSIAYVAAWVADITENDVLLEPSAGIGGLALFGKANGAKVFVNEYSDRRADIIEQMGFEKVFREDGEQLNNILPEIVKPNVVLMNPPFSTAGHRTGGKADTKNATKHINQALKRLEEGGRLVAIVGQGMSEDAPAFRAWWKDVKTKYNVRANIGVYSDETTGRFKHTEDYKKYGTDYGIQLVVIDKNGPTVETITANNSDLEDVVDVLGGIANDRVRTENNRNNEQVSGSENMPESAGTGRRDPVNVRADNTPNVRVGDGQQGSRSDVGTSTSGDGESTRDNRHNGNQQTNPDGERTGKDTESDRNAEVKAESTGDILNQRGVSDTELNGEDVIEIESKEEVTNVSEDEVFSEYKPQKLLIKNAKPHASPLVQSTAMASVSSPDVNYTPMLAKEIIEKGILSLAQMESVVYAGQSHETVLENGERRGFYIGDGTGVGKGRQVSGIIMDNWNRGRKKTIWFSKNNKLFEDAIRDWTALGGKKEDVFQAKANVPIDRKDGILFATYNLLPQGQKPNKSGKKVELSRMDQMVNWFGKDFDGVIVFDEAHQMGNLLGAKPSEMAKAGAELQKRLPNARVVYASATGATEVENFAYASRLGLWGKGTAFNDLNDFVSEIQSGGLAAMELIARDMKAMGLYIARSISFKGVGYSTIEHRLTPVQKEIYDTMADGWQIVLQNLNKYLDETGQNKSSKARRYVLQNFGSTQQRFFNQILTSMQMPSVIDDMKKRLANGESCVLQLVNTNAAAEEREAARIAADEDADLDDMDITPKGALLEMIGKVFPIDQYEDYTDDNGKQQSRPVLDAAGKPVINQEALRAKEELMKRIDQMQVPNSAMDMILQEFGVDNVTEVTGRTRRFVFKKDSTGQIKRQEESRSETVVAADVAAFLNDKKQILIFSDAGGTGKSYHAGKEFKNQRKRIHYLIQAGWNASKAVQGFGRTHRTNQVSTPEYVLVTTNLKGQKRFISSIARRLDQLGALTKGQRQTGSSGLFSAKDNLESREAKDALQLFYTHLAARNIPEMDPDIILNKMGLTQVLLDKNGNLTTDVDKLRDVTRFLNRILALDSTEQNRVFDEFSRRVDLVVENAIQKGTLDVGMENYKHMGAVLIDEKVARTDSKTGAQTKYVSIKAKKKAFFIPYEELRRRNEEAFIGIYKEKSSGEIRAAIRAGDKTNSDGSITKTYYLQTPVYGQRSHFVEKTFTDNWEKVTDGAKALWVKETKAYPDFIEETIHMVTGTLLPVWNVLPQEHARVMRITLDDGSNYLGRLIPPTAIDGVLRKLGVSRDKQTYGVAESVKNVLEKNMIIRFTDGKEIIRSRVAGENRLELKGDNLWSYVRNYKGIFDEKVGTWRYFVPLGEKGISIIEDITKSNPILEVAASQTLEKTNAPDPFAGKPVDTVGIVPAGIAIGPEVSYHPADATMEEAFKRSWGLPKEGFLSKLKEKLTDAVHGITRTFVHLDPAKFAVAIDEFRKYPSIRERASDKAYRTINTIIGNLSKEEYKRFNYIVLLQDLNEDIKAGLTLPDGYTESNVQDELDNLKQYITPNIEQALNDRAALWDQVRADYIASSLAHGFDPSDRFTRDNYFRHQVVEKFHNRDYVTGPGKKPHVQTNRGFLKERAGTTLDINSNYLESEYEVLSSLYADTAKNQMLTKIKDTYNIKDALVAEAEAHNRGALKQIIDDEKAANNGKSTVAEALNRLDQDIDRLLKELKDATDLWKGDKGEYKKTLDKVTDEMLNGLQRPNSLLFYLGRLSTRGDSHSQDAKALMRLVAGKYEFVQETLNAHNALKTWKNFMSEDYEVFQPREGNAFYMAESISEKIADDLMNNVADSYEIVKEDLRTVLALGKKFEELALPKEVVATMNELGGKQEARPVSALVSGPLRMWKRWVTGLNPRQVVKYNFRNFVGDFDALLAGAPGAVKFTQRALNDLYLNLKGGQFSADLREFYEQGGYSATMYSQEITGVNDFKEFRKFNLKDTTLAEQVADAVKAPFKSYAEFVGDLSDYREMLLRYSAYLYFKDHIQKNGCNVKNYAASNRKFIDGLDTVQSKAYNLSDDLLGAYDKVSATGQAIRKYHIPFWSFQETNFRRYVNLFRNAGYDPSAEKSLQSIGQSVLKKTGAAVTLAPKVLAKLGWMFVKVNALGIMLAMWNKYGTGGADDELPDDVRNQPHITFGRDENGNVVYFTRLGSFTDFLEWFGLDTGYQDGLEILEGRKTWQEQIIDMAKSPINKLYTGYTPEFKLPLELITGISWYPDVFRGSSIKDRGEYAARTIGLQNEYKAVAGLPTRSLGGTWLEKMGNYFRDAVSYKTDPQEAAYYKALDLKSEFEQKVQGRSPSSVMNKSDKSLALYYFKQSIKFKDTDAAEKYITKYFEKGGNAKGANQSLATLNPLYGISADEKKQMYQWLSKDDQAVVDKAVKYYNDNLVMGKTNIQSLEAIYNNKYLNKDQKSAQLKKLIEVMMK